VAISVHVLVTNPRNTVCKWVYTNSILFVQSF